MMDTIVRKKGNHGSALEYLRRGDHLTQDDLAERTGFTQKTIWKYENEEIIPKDKLEIFAKFFEVPVSFFDRYNFQEAKACLVGQMCVDAKDNSVNTGVVEEQIVHQDSPKTHELYREIISMTEQIGEIKIENALLKKENSDLKAQITK